MPSLLLAEIKPFPPPFSHFLSHILLASPLPKSVHVTVLDAHKQEIRMETPILMEFDTPRRASLQPSGDSREGRR